MLMHCGKAGFLSANLNDLVRLQRVYESSEAVVVLNNTQKKNNHRYK